MSTPQVRPCVQPLRWRDRLLILTGLVAVFIPGTIGVSLFDRDEGWYAQITREMVDSGDWIVPRYLGESRYYKPPLMFWCSAVSGQLLGWSEFALRLPCVLATIAAWLLVVEITAGWAGRRAGYWCAVLAGTCLGTNLVGKLMLADGYLLLLVTAAMFSWFRQLDAEPGSGKHSYGFWISLGFAVLAKGPAVLVVLVPVALVFFWSEPARGSSFKQRCHRIWPGPGCYVAAFIALPWYVAVSWLDWESFLREFVLVHFVDRLKQPMEGHAGFPGYYLATSLVFLWPWAALVPSILIAAWSARRSDGTTRRLMVWLIAPWIVFELIQTKLPHYALPLFPPLAMLMARELARVTSTPAEKLRLDSITRWVWLGGILLAATALIAATVWLWNRYDMSGIAALSAVLLLILAIGLWPGERSWRRCAIVVTIGMVVFYQILGWIVVPMAEPHRLSRLVAAQANKIAQVDDRIFAYGYQEPTLFYYLDQPARVLRPDQADWRKTVGDSFVLIARDTKLDALRSVLKINQPAGRIIEGINYVRGRRVRVWIGRVQIMTGEKAVNDKQ